MDPEPYDDGPGKPVGDMQFVSPPLCLLLHVVTLSRLSRPSSTSLQWCLQALTASHSLTAGASWHRTVQASTAGQHIMPCSPRCFLCTHSTEREESEALLVRRATDRPDGQPRRQELKYWHVCRRTSSPTFGTQKADYQET